MSDQPAMQAYVRRRMAGTEPAPQPAPNAPATYVQAQLLDPTIRNMPLGGSGGARVPEDMMTDSEQFLVPPDVGSETTSDTASVKHLDAQQRQQRSAELLQQMQQLSRQMDAPTTTLDERRALFQQWSAISDQLENMHQQALGSFDRLRRIGEGQQQVPGDVNAIQQGMDTQQAVPRQPFAPPAPGGTPLVPVTRNLGS